IHSTSFIWATRFARMKSLGTRIPAKAAMIQLSPPSDLRQRVRVSGKFFRLGSAKFYIKGFCYGPFDRNSKGDFLPETARMADDFRHMQVLGANTVRLYTIPSLATLDAILEHGLRALIDVPLGKHPVLFAGPGRKGEDR